MFLMLLPPFVKTSWKWTLPWHGTRKTVYLKSNMVICLQRLASTAVTPPNPTWPRQHRNSTDITVIAIHQLGALPCFLSHETLSLKSLTCTACLGRSTDAQSSLPSLSPSQRLFRTKNCVNGIDSNQCCVTGLRSAITLFSQARNLSLIVSLSQICTPFRRLLLLSTRTYTHQATHWLTAKSVAVSLPLGWLAVGYIIFPDRLINGQAFLIYDVLRAHWANSVTIVAYMGEGGGGERISGERKGGGGGGGRRDRERGGGERVRVREREREREREWVERGRDRGRRHRISSKWNK